MLPLKNLLMPQMTKGTFQLLCSALLVLTFISNTCAEPKYRTPARILAKQTGATQFEEERYETHTNCNEHKHHLRKRASDEDVDYEVYQGVVGRPGIDFPIYPRIPKTTFSCRSFGNGYFADMETECQVFHICEEGRKISFLCPNGTIFHQSELTCDWWFKVNCLGSSGYYGESSEILNKQRVHRVRPSVPVQGFNIVGGGLNYKPKVVVGQARTKSTAISAAGGKSDRRIDSNEEVHSLETVDFDDVSGEKQRKVIASIDNNSEDNESQITAESASFVGSNGGKRRNNYEESVPKTVEQQPKPLRRVSVSNGDRNGSAQKHGHNESTERARNGQRGQQRFKEKNKDSYERGNAGASTVVGIVESSAEAKKPLEKRPETQDKPEFYEAHSTRNLEKLQTTTPYLATGTYTTARRFDSTRSTPFYTPTIPSISKTKSTEGKQSYIKGQGSLLATTPNPNRFSLGGSSGLFPESSAAPRPTASAADVYQTDAAYKPIIIGMRHHYDVGASAESLDISLKANSPLNGEQPIKTIKIKGNGSSKDYLPSTTSAPSSTGPTYLPKSGTLPKSVAGSAGDELLFAPGPIHDDFLPRNVQDMLKTMNLLKDKFDDVEVNIKTPGREGLEIPPSSGPDALVSLAKYFAQEHNDSTAKTLNSLDSDNETKLRLPVKPQTSAAAASSATDTADISIISKKPSDTTTSITTPSTPLSISKNADDIKSSLLSQKTVNKYADLFGLKDSKGKETSSSISDGLLTGVNATKDNDNGNYNLFPQIGSTGATISALAEKPESRKIAQVFSNALNTYLKDPQTLRAELAAARPTEPPNFTPVTNPDTDYFNEGTARTYLPTKPTPDYTTTTSNIAAEINNKFDYSTVSQDYTSTTEAYDATTYRISKERQSLELSAELAPPSADSGEDDEVLHRLQTQSFVKSDNDLTKAQRKQRPEKLIDATKPTEHPWTLKSQTDFLDPLTINDGLMKEHRTTTLTPFTYLPKDAHTTNLPAFARSNGHFQILAEGGQRGDQHANGYEWEDIFSSYDIPREALPSSSGLQRIANKLFGGLNEQEALHLKSVMAHAEHNRQVLSLLLLLIQTCDDQNGKALERSRKHLLNALIDIDSKLEKQGATVSKSSALKEAPATTTTKPPTPTTTLRPSVTTFRRAGDDLYASTTPATPTTTTDLPISTTTLTPGNEETTKFEIRVEDPEDEYASTTNTPTVVSNNSDRRALELLKSLYSLASKFSSRR